MMPALDSLCLNWLGNKANTSSLKSRTLNSRGACLVAPMYANIQH